MQAVHIGTLGTTLQRGESSVAGTKKESLSELRLSQSGGYLLSPDAISAVPSAMLCVGGSAASPRHAPVSAHTARPTPSELPTADTARASEAGLAMSNAG